MSERISAFQGNRVYLDTMIPYAFLRGIDHEVARFFTRLERGEFVAHTSVLAFDELAYRLLLALIRDRYGGWPLELLRDHEATLMAEFYPKLLPRLSELATFANLVVESVDIGDWALAQQLMTEHALKPRDAIHLATKARIGCLDLASNDDDFDRVPEVRRFSTA